MAVVRLQAGIPNNKSSINGAQQLSQILTNFLGEFKNMFTQLLNQNSMILTMLTTVINKIAK
jgi:hypothetical protein